MYVQLYFAAGGLVSPLESIGCPLPLIELESVLVIAVPSDFVDDGGVMNRSLEGFLDGGTTVFVVPPVSLGVAFGVVSFGAVIWVLPVVTLGAGPA